MILSFRKTEETVKHKIIYADPCWAYDNEKTGGSLNSSAQSQYDVMTVEELEDFGVKVKAVSSHNAACFMWVTGPFLMDGSAYKVMQAWGFAPKCIAFVWVKTYADGEPINGMGFYTRSSVEYVLLGVTGEFKRKNAGVRQLIEAPEVVKLPRLKHSEKPNEVRERILTLCGDIPRIELFSRHKIPGWTYHGNQIL